MQKIMRYRGPALAFAGALVFSAAAYAAGPDRDHSRWSGHGQSRGSQDGPGNFSASGGNPQSQGQGPQSQGQGPQAYQFHGRDVNQFSDSDRGRWTSGRWNHGRHDNVDGWWWFAGGAWYFYDEPVYPYPDYVSTEIVDDQQDEPAGPYWYYCNNPKGYYPYVRSCGGKWEPVPMTPPDLQNQPDSGDEGPAPDDADHGAPPGADNMPPPPDH